MRRQTGAALVIGLMLLCILTLLAVSTMNTAATELLMSGNDQYQLRAAQAAQLGIEQTIATAAFTGVQTFTDPALPGGDAYSAILRPRGATPAPTGYNNTFTAEHFEIESTGRSHRGAKTVHVQGLFIVRVMTLPASTGSALPPVCLAGAEIRLSVCKPFGTPIRTYWRPSRE